MNRAGNLQPSSQDYLQKTSPLFPTLHLAAGHRRLFATHTPADPLGLASLAAPGDSRDLYTDGVFEAANTAREEFGKSRCKEFLESHWHLPAAHLADDLLTSIAAFSGLSSTRAQEDDITLLVLDFQAAGSQIQ